jgi:hypothetical protein
VAETYKVLSQKKACESTVYVSATFDKFDVLSSSSYSTPAALLRKGFGVQVKVRERNEPQFREVLKEQRRTLLNLRSSNIVFESILCFFCVFIRCCFAKIYTHCIIDSTGIDDRAPVKLIAIFGACFIQTIS